NYGGDSFWYGDNAPYVQNVNKAVASLNLGSSANPTVVGQPVTFTTTVSAADSTVPAVPTGSVIFMDGASILGSSPLVNGSATLSTSTLVVGSNNISATYSGDSI